MITSLQRTVVAKCIELETDMDALADYINESHGYQLIDHAERDRLRRQLSAMTAYRDVLAERIRAFQASPA